MSNSEKYSMGVWAYDVGRRMPCGHGSWSVATSSEGTNYCQECELIGRLEAELEQLRASREVWATRAAEQEARAEQVEACLAEERACHDCDEYRALMNRRAKEAEAELERLILLRRQGCLND